jgi:hypothetical protein
MRLVSIVCGISVYTPAFLNNSLIFLPFVENGVLRNRIERIATRVAFRLLTAKERPQDEFGGTFFDIRQKVNGLKEELSQKAKDSLQKELTEDLKDKGYEVVSVAVSLGKYRGSHFITSAKVSVKVKSSQQANELAKHLQKYSPKYTLKSLENGIAFYNIR